MDGGAWLTVDGTRVDLIYRDLDEVLRWTAAAQDGRFEIQREVGYAAGIATYVLTGELALGRVLAGDLPCPQFPPRLRETAPVAWARLAAGALHFAGVHAGRQDRVGCLANLGQAVLAAAQGRMAAAGQWVLNEKRLTERAGLHAAQDLLAQPGRDLAGLVSDVRACLELRDAVLGMSTPSVAALPPRRPPSAVRAPRSVRVQERQTEATQRRPGAEPLDTGARA